MSASVTINGTVYTVPQKDDTDYAATFTALLQALCAAAASILTFGAASGITASSDRFARPGIAAIDTTEVFWVAPVAGKLSLLRAYAAAVASGGSVVICVRKNGSDTALTCTISASGQSASDATNTVTVAAGDRISFRVTGGSGFASGATNLILTAAFTPS